MNKKILNILIISLIFGIFFTRFSNLHANIFNGIDLTGSPGSIYDELVSRELQTYSPAVTAADTLDEELDGKLLNWSKQVKIPTNPKDRLSLVFLKIIKDTLSAIEKQKKNQNKVEIPFKDYMTARARVIIYLTVGHHLGWPVYPVIDRGDTLVAYKLGKKGYLFHDPGEGWTAEVKSPENWAKLRAYDKIKGDKYSQFWPLQKPTEILAFILDSVTVSSRLELPAQRTMQILGRAQSLDPKNPHYYLQLASSNLNVAYNLEDSRKKGKKLTQIKILGMALEHSQKALSLDPLNANALNLSGIIHTFLGLKKEKKGGKGEHLLSASEHLKLASQIAVTTLEAKPKYPQYSGFEMAEYVLGYIHSLTHHGFNKDAREIAEAVAAMHKEIDLLHFLENLPDDMEVSKKKSTATSKQRLGLLLYNITKESGCDKVF